MKREKKTEAIGLLIRAVRQHRRLCEETVQGMGIHHSQHRLLMHLSRYDGMPSQKELAQALHISSAAIAVSVKKLEQSGFISRVSDNADKRRNRLEITNKGKSVISKTHTYFSDIDAHAFDGFSESEFEIFYGMLDKVYYNLKERKLQNEEMV